MATITLQDISDDVKALLDRIKAGEKLVIVCDGRPVAELRPVAAPRKFPRPFGRAAGAFTVPDDFDTRLPDSILREFDGR